EVEDQSGDKIAKAISDILKICNQHSITISCIVSDNAASLKSAITSNDPKKEFTLKALIVMEVLRCSFAAHTSQLSVKDLISTIPFLEEYLSKSSIY
ncbi:hypothetical protein M9Y10_015541, partial [Tritrichomonas musculus]